MDTFSSNPFELLTAFVMLAWLAAQVRVILMQRRDHQTLNPFFTLEIIPLGLMVFFYLCLAVDLDPLHSSTELRLAVFRPAFVTFGFLHACYLLNGKINLVQLKAFRWIRRRYK